MAVQPTDCSPQTASQKEAGPTAFTDSIGPNAVYKLASLPRDSKPCRMPPIEVSTHASSSSFSMSMQNRL
ncbi:hypothetical protein GQ53DRAFT_740422 [Thozetella sp. PMI_491]|nr:hypothetical protein GQ53DRAFT_740422 [Thozetella sp. PMI_491]